MLCRQRVDRTAGVVSVTSPGFEWILYAVSVAEASGTLLVCEVYAVSVALGHALPTARDVCDVCTTLG